MDGSSNAVPETIVTRLLPGERVLWWGRPRQGVMLAARDALLIPFSLLWCGFVVFWESIALNIRAPSFFPLFGIPFVLVGLYMVAGRFIVDAWARQRIVYALTDRRVLILRTGPWSSFQSLSLDRLPEASLNEGANGRGTIRFGPQVSTWGGQSRGMGWSGWTPGLSAVPQFLAIEDAQRVFAAVQQQTHRDLRR